MDTGPRQRFFVSPSSFDNIGAVLNSMGQGFAHAVVGWAELKRWRAAAPRDVLFLNCALRYSFGYGKRVARMVRGFVEAGGTLYASDRALAAVTEAFPQMLKIDGGGAKGSSNCDVVDRGLQEMIGKQIKVTFDMGGWRRMQPLDSSARVYVAAVAGGSANASAGLPIVVGFRYGQGHVLCTSFHNKAQTSEAERWLLRFLVLQPVLARAAADVAQSINARQFQPGEQIFATVDCGQTSQPFIFDARAGQSMLYCLNWSGSARLRLSIKDPAGNVHFDRASKHPPLGCEVARAAAGRWLCEVSGADLPHDNFPFVLTLAAGCAQPPSRRLPAPSVTLSSPKSAYTIPPPPPPRPRRRG